MFFMKGKTFRTQNIIYQISNFDYQILEICKPYFEFREFDEQKWERFKDK